MTTAKSDRPEINVSRREIIVSGRTPCERLELKLAKGDWPTAGEILRAIEGDLTTPLPPRLREHIMARLDGKAKKKRGPMPDRNAARDLFIWANYYRFHRWLRLRQKTIGLEGWRVIRSADWWHGPPSDRAARMVQKQLRLNLTWEEVQGIAERVNRKRGPGKTERCSKSVRPNSPKTSRT